MWLLWTGLKIMWRTINTTTVCLSLSLNHHLHHTPFIRLDYWSFTQQGVFSECNLMLSLSVPRGTIIWWLADYHLIKRQAGKRRTCHSLRSSSEHRNKTCWRLVSCLLIPEGKWFPHKSKCKGRTFTVKIARFKCQRHNISGTQIGPLVFDVSSQMILTFY